MSKDFSSLLLAIHYLVQHKIARVSYSKMSEVWCTLWEDCGQHNDKVPPWKISSFSLFPKISFYLVLCEIWTPVFYLLLDYFRCPLELLGCYIHHGEWFYHFPANKKLSLYWWSETQTFLNRSLVILPIFHY